MRNFLKACGLAVGVSLFSMVVNDAKAQGWGGGHHHGASSCGQNYSYGSYYGGPSVRVIPGGYQSGFGYSSYYGGGYGQQVLRPFGGFGPAYGTSYGSPIGGYGSQYGGYGRGINIGGGGIRINF